MPRYPRSASGGPEYRATLEGIEEEAELDCGFLIQENEYNDTPSAGLGHRIELWFCALHETAQEKAR